METEDEGHGESFILQNVIRAIKVLNQAGICAINIQAILNQVLQLACYPPGDAWHGATN